VLRFAKVGVRAEYNNFSYPNSISLVGCVIGNHEDSGVYITGGTTFNMFGGSVESNGLTGSAALKYGVLLNNSGVEGAVAGNFSGVYFENNKGVADIWLANSATAASTSIAGCSFARISSTNFVTNNILVETSNAGVTQSINVSGCGFKNLGTYVPDSGRKYISSLATDGGVSTVAWSGCVFQSSTETPTISNEIGLTPFLGWTAVTFQNSWADSGAPATACGYYKDSFGVVRLRGNASRASNSSATIFTLPAGFRPTGTLLIGAYNEVTSVASATPLSIDSSGNVSLPTAGNKVSLDSISFQTN
jgi:hypothetical protein